VAIPLVDNAENNGDLTVAVFLLLLLRDDRGRIGIRDHPSASSAAVRPVDWDVWNLQRRRDVCGIDALKKKAKKSVWM